MHASNEEGKAGLQIYLVGRGTSFLLVRRQRANSLASASDRILAFFSSPFDDNFAPGEIPCAGLFPSRSEQTDQVTTRLFPGQGFAFRTT